MEIPKITFALSAFKQVKQTVDDLQKELHDTSEAITTLEAEMIALPKLRAPFEDLKQGVLDLVGAAGERYANQHFKAQIISFATGGMMDNAGVNWLSEYDEVGRPLRLGTLDGAVNGTRSKEARAQFITPAKPVFDDLALYALFGDAVKAALTAAMQDMTPDDFGYSKINPDEIGPTRAELNRILGSKQAEIEALSARKKELLTLLGELGVKVNSRMEKAADAKKKGN